MGGGKGGGSPEIPREIEETSETLRDIGLEQFQTGLPITQLGAENLLQLLQTGSSPGLLPAISTATEAERSAQNIGLKQLEEQATLQGLTGTALQETLARGNLAAEQAAASVPGRFTLPILQNVGGNALNLTGQGLQGIGQAGNLAGVSAGPASAGFNAGGALVGAGSGALAGASSFGLPGAIGGGVLGLLGGK